MISEPTVSWWNDCATPLIADSACGPMSWCSTSSLVTSFHSSPMIAWIVVSMLSWVMRSRVLVIEARSIGVGSSFIPASSFSGARNTSIAVD